SLYSSGVNNEYLKKIRKSDSNKIVKNLNMEVDFREIIGDNPDDINDNKYGNNNVKGPDAGHGTLVAGVIAANRNNKIGINGVAEGVEIMAMRVVPDGDEYDKDVALAIKYAVDNGANVINMSFGKAYSPQKKFVEEAIKYAEKHNVLLVHAAGNDGVNNDSIEHYPTAKFDDGTISNNVLTIGASTFKADKNFAGFFSNYGQSVDIFAPGVNIISLLPENKYTMANGTSFSCPLVTGVAALVWSFYPELTALQLAEIIKKSGTRHSRLKVYCPEKQTPKQVKIKFAKLCNTGASVNAYKALIMAEKFTGSISK
ncbi:MAG: S8 family serine peptidase, partial [Bacteroidetes bacterium]|nr:S8 family serine peptidase [Bacteroidota bacterium]